MRLKARALGLKRIRQPRSHSKARAIAAKPPNYWPQHTGRRLLTPAAKVVYVDYIDADRVAAAAILLQTVTMQAAALELRHAVVK